MSGVISAIWTFIKTAPVWLPVAREIVQTALKFYAQLKEIKDASERRQKALEIIGAMDKAIDEKNQMDLEKALGNPSPGENTNAPGSYIERGEQK